MTTTGPAPATVTARRWTAAQRFAAVFGLGPDDRHIAPLDAAGADRGARGQPHEARPARAAKARQHPAVTGRKLRITPSPSDSERAAIEAALAYYRALLRHPAPVLPERRVLPHTTLVVWGMRDRALVAANSEGLERWVPRVRVVRVPEAAHWVMADAPGPVNAALLELLREQW